MPAEPLVRPPRAAILALTLALGCAPAPAPRPTAATAAAPTATGTPSAAPTADAPVVPAEPPARSTNAALARFHDALSGLEKKTRKEHVRILWLGDSHGQADFWSGAVRSALQARFGSGGPGFLHAGYKNYRHDGIKLEIRGKWRMRPKRPTTTKREGDGLFGLGGLMMGGYADAPRVGLELTAPLPGARVQYDLCYRFRDPGDRVRITPAGGAETELAPSAERAVGGVLHEVVTGPTPGGFVVEPRGKADLCGLIVESDPSAHPGVVLDTLAINGARYGTALAWDETAWKAEVARRAPSLVIYEYGTNEAGDAQPGYERVARELAALHERVRSAAPGADCVVVSPTDRADAESRVPPMREALRARATQLGCGWFDPFELLGGSGAMRKLAEEPDPRVQDDGIHLTIKGYRELGAAMTAMLLVGYPSAPTPVERATPSR